MHIESEQTTLVLQVSRTAEAEQWFRRAQRLAPGDSSVYHHYGKQQTRTQRRIEYLNIAGAVVHGPIQLCAICTAVGLQIMAIVRTFRWIFFNWTNYCLVVTQ